MTGPSVERLHVGRPNLGPRDVFDSYVDRIYATNWLTNDGPIVHELETAIANRVGVRNCVAMSNGTVALEIAVRALGLTGEVIVPSFTFVATAHALSWQGVTPVFADIDEATHCLDPQSVEAAISPETTGIIGVHTWGRASPIEKLQNIADRHGLALMFDAAHAFDCTYGGHTIGGFGRAEVFSFHATKFFNTFEGGAIVTNDDDLAARARLMRNFGFAGYDNVVYAGTNGKMTEISAAMGMTNLTVLEDIKIGNARTHDAYAAALDKVAGVSLVVPDLAERNNFQYVVGVVDAGAEVRDRILSALHSRGVLARRYFWPGVHRMPVYASSALRVPLPVTEHIADRVLVLPGGPSIAAREVDRVTNAIEEAINAV
ncbi:dTDP-4-dehydro-6-deoxyglucose aminotransferase [Knoellia aerolata DSM 18566]|uniref:dTDP-4-dehydro-6-deoxyglucose aminotransferase n=1 Tax=Knoellia aerolata DSM 18566 TaxID=1385519 RepID=A0A0A0JW10_9MICO|nr:dTDP-4-dehydro-6-deoxyglucose aminotransferase [Knoellia aerolata DSM 18566]